MNMAQGLYSDDLDIRYKSIKDFRKMLSKRKKTIILLID